MLVSGSVTCIHTLGHASFWLTDWLLYPHIQPVVHPPCSLTCHILRCPVDKYIASRQVQMCLASSHWRVSWSRLPKRSLNLQFMCRSKCGYIDEANVKQHDQLETSVSYSEHFSERLVKNIVVVGIPSYRTSILYTFGNSDPEFVQYEYWSRAQAVWANL